MHCRSNVIVSNVWIIYDTHRIECLCHLEFAESFPSLFCFFPPPPPHNLFFSSQQISDSTRDAKLLPKSEKQVMLGQVWASPLQIWRQEVNFSRASPLFIHAATERTNVYISHFPLSPLFLRGLRGPLSFPHIFRILNFNLIIESFIFDFHPYDFQFQYNGFKFKSTVSYQSRSACLRYRNLRIEL